MHGEFVSQIEDVLALARMVTLEQMQNALRCPVENPVTGALAILVLEIDT